MKMRIGTAYPRAQEVTMEVRGRNLISGLPRTIEVSSSEMLDALEEVVTSIVEAVRLVLENTPPELAADIGERGIVMTGGGSLLHGLDKLIQEKTGINVVVAEDPISCVAIGTGIALEYSDMLEQLEFNKDKY